MCEQDEKWPWSRYGLPSQLRGTNTYAQCLSKRLRNQIQGNTHSSSGVRTGSRSVYCPAPSCDDDQDVREDSWVFVRDILPSITDNSCNPLDTGNAEPFSLSLFLRAKRRRLVRLSSVCATWLCAASLARDLFESRLDWLAPDMVNWSEIQISILNQIQFPQDRKHIANLIKYAQSLEWLFGVFLTFSFFFFFIPCTADPLS